MYQRCELTFDVNDIDIDGAVCKIRELVIDVSGIEMDVDSDLYR